MLLTIGGFLVALVLAIPTFGLSLVAFFVLKALTDRSSREKLASAVVRAREFGNETVSIGYVNNAAIRSFFHTFGTTELKYKSTLGVYKGLYSGYVSVNDTGEVLVTVIKNGGTTIISCFSPPLQFGQDFLSLSHKAAFHDQVVGEIVNRTPT